jgi:hypothetical protein
VLPDAAADQQEETINEDNDHESSSKPRELCESAFPFRNDLMFGTDHKDINIHFLAVYCCSHGFRQVND